METIKPPSRRTSVDVETARGRLRHRRPRIPRSLRGFQLAAGCFFRGFSHLQVIRRAAPPRNVLTSLERVPPGSARVFGLPGIRSVWVPGTGPKRHTAIQKSKLRENLVGESTTQTGLGAVGGLVSPPSGLAGCSRVGGKHPFPAPSFFSLGCGGNQSSRT